MTDPLDEPFLALAFAAFIAEARECGGWPDQEKTRQRAYGMYEAELRAKDVCDPQ